MFNEKVFCRKVVVNERGKMVEGILSIIASLLGIGEGVSSLIYKPQKNGKRNIHLKWEDVQNGVEDLSNKVFKDFSPELIMCSSTGASGIIANLFFLTHDKYIPTIFGNHRKIEDGFTIPMEESRSICFETSKWKAYLPDELACFSDRRILILEDVVLTGDSLEREKELLRKCNYEPKNIKAAAVYVSQTALNSNKAPDFYHRILKESVRYYYPWGRTIYGKGYEDIKNS